MAIATASKAPTAQTPAAFRLTSYGSSPGEHRPIRKLRGLDCGEPEAEPYTAGHPRPAPLRPSTPSRVYPVESAVLQADRIALSLRGALERTTVPLARTAAALVTAKSWCDLGFARLDDYARERLGRSGRWVRDLATLGERLGSLPALAPAITGEGGGRPIGRVAALLIAKVASPSSLNTWIARAQASSTRALRDAVRAERAAPSDAAPSDDALGAALASTPRAAPLSTSAAASAVAPTAELDDDDDADRLLVRMTVPAPVLAAFDEALDLFRAVEGGSATIASFVEALIAEAAARGDVEVAASDGDAAFAAGGADMRALRVGPAIAALERALATSTENWRHLPEHVESSWALSLAGVTLARFRALADEAGHGGAADLDRQLRALVDLENELETRLGGLLADLTDRRAWPRLRFAGVGHYGEERLGLSRTAAEDRARLARDLRKYPRLREACAAGRLSRETAALVVRILRDGPTGATAAESALEAAWVARATEATVKRMRDEARAVGRYRLLRRRASASDVGGGSGGAVPLAGPGSPADGSAPADAATPAALAAPDLAPLDDAAWHASLRREPGLARRRIHFLGRLTFTSPDVFQALPHESDTFLGLRLPLDLGRQLLETVDAERRRLTAAADAIPWDEEVEPPSAPASWLAARMFSIRGRRLPAWVGLLSLLEGFVDTWDDETGMPRLPGDEIYIRDGWRCAAPGCTSRRNLEDHHLRYRSRGGNDDPANRICLCRFHHQRGEHGGLASCRGRAPTGVTWRLGRRDLPGCEPSWYRNERRIAAG